MSGGGCGCYRNANIDETDILVGQLGCYMPHHLSQIINQDRPSNHKEDLVFSCLHTVYTVQRTCLTGVYTTHRSNTYKSGTVCLYKMWHNTTQHSTVQLQTICPNQRSSSHLSNSEKEKLIWIKYYFDHHLMQMIINNVGQQHDQVLVQTIAMIQSREATRPSIVAVFTGGGHWQWHLPDLAILSNARLVFSWVQAWCN